MKLKFKRFLKRFLIVTVTLSFLFCFLTLSSSAYSVSGSEYNSFEYSDLIFSGIPLISYWSTDDPSVVTYLDDDLVSSIRYRFTSSYKLVLDLYYNDPVFSYGNTYEILLRFSPSDKLKTPDQVSYGSYDFILQEIGNGFFPIVDSVSSYRTGVDSSTNTAVVDYALVYDYFPTFTSTFSVSDSNKIIYDYYYLKFRFTYGWSSSSSPRSFIFLSLSNTDFQSMSFSQFDSLYGWDSPVPPPSMDNVIESGKLENQILSDTSADVETTKNFLTNFKLYTWLQNGLLAVTNIFEIFAKLPFIDNLLEYSLVLGIFAFIVGMSVSLMKPSGKSSGGRRSGGRRR